MDGDTGLRDRAAGSLSTVTDALSAAAGVLSASAKSLLGSVLSALLVFVLTRRIS